MTQHFILNSQEMAMETCWKCGTPHSFSKAIFDVAKAQAGHFEVHCPLGHKWVYKSVEKEREEEKLRRERDALKQRIAEKDDAIIDERNAREAAERKASAARGQVTRLKNRAKAGMCPCCNRHFTNLERHMAAKHSDEKAEV